MLYGTTRNNRDVFTAQRVLRENRAADGGLYLPFRSPVFTKEDIDGLAQKSFGQNVADVLNVLFKMKLSGWDVDFAIGRYPVRLNPLQHRIIMAEPWHNPEWTYDRLVNNLVSRLCDEATLPGNWVKIAVRIAVLFGIFGDLKRSGVDSADVSVVSGDFSAPISAWYARKWGLPIRNIIICCNENHSVWDLLCHGQIRTDSVSIPTITPEADVTVPEDLERLIYECGGIPEVRRYLDACRAGRSYSLPDPALSRMQSGLFVSVASSARLKEVIPGVYRTNQYLLSSYGALAYSGLLDYRSKTGETMHAIVLAEKSPVSDLDTVAKAMNMSSDALKRMIEQG